MVSPMWLAVFLLLHLNPELNQRHYAIPLNEVRFMEVSSDGTQHFKLLPTYKTLKNQGIDQIYTTRIPVATYRGFYVALAITGFSLLVGVLIAYKEAQNKTA